jgi:hypothetical protein
MRRGEGGAVALPYAVGGAEEQGGAARVRPQRRDVREMREGARDGPGVAEPAEYGDLRRPYSTVSIKLSPF